jgi:3-oxoacyl-[acyl-carrier-protein] synthase III
MSERPVYLAAAGAYLPGPAYGFREAQRALGDLGAAPASLRAWFERTGAVMEQLLDIRAYHYAFDPATGEYFDDNVSMAVRAARIALERARIEPAEVDCICYGSAHQDQMPAASARIQHQLGMDRCEELSIHANCTSAYKALHCANALIASGRNQTALVLSSNVASSELRSDYFNPDKLDRESLFLRWFLCDGAGAAVVTSRTPSRPRLRLAATFIESLGKSKPSLMYNERPGYWMNPRDEYEAGAHHLRQRFANALNADIFQEPDGSVFVKGLDRMLSAASIDPAAIALFQVNLPARHIAESVAEECERLGISPAAWLSHMHELGYAGPPMAFISLDAILRDHDIAPGRYIVSFVTEVSKFMQAGYAFVAE